MPCPIAVPRGLDALALLCCVWAAGQMFGFGSGGALILAHTTMQPNRQLSMSLSF